MNFPPEMAALWPVTEPPASVLGFFVAQAMALRLPLDHSQTPFPFSEGGAEVCVAAVEMPVPLRERGREGKRRGEREREREVNQEV